MPLELVSGARFTVSKRFGFVGFVGDAGDEMTQTNVVSTVHLRVPDGSMSPWLHEVLAYMAQHCADATLTGVAHAFGCHPNTISTTIRHKLRTTFADLLLEMRMQRAASLLSHGIPSRSVAECCGYSDLASFGHAFRRRFGVTPSQWAGAERDLCGMDLAVSAGR